MDFFNSLSFGYKVMLIGIVVFFIGVIIMFIESRVQKRSSQEIKENYLIKNNVRTSENPAISNETLFKPNPEVNNTPPDNNPVAQSNSNSELMDMYK